MAAALGDFLEYVLPGVPGCPDVAARLEIRRACVEFCRQTRIWKVWLTPVNTVAGQMEYALPVPTGAALWLVEEVKLGDSRLWPMTREDALATYGETWDTTGRGEAKSYLMPDPETMALVPIPEVGATAALKVYATLEPTQTATTVPDVLVERYPETIAHGALARLLAAPGKTWANPQLAVWHQQRFQADIGGYAGRAAAGGTRRRLKTTATSSVGRTS